MTERVEAVMAILTSYGLSVISAIVILIAGWAAGTIWLKSTKSDKKDMTLESFLPSMAIYAILAFTFVAVLSRFGVETTSFLVVIGALGLAISQSLQGTSQAAYC